MVGEIDIPKGFKKTEVGVIPEDWEVKKLENISKIIMGQSPLSKFYNQDFKGLPLIQGKADLINRKSVPRIFTTGLTKICETGDIIITVRAPVGSVGRATEKSCLGRGVCAIKNNNDYLYYYFLFIENSWNKISKGSTFDSINANDIKELNIKIPINMEEQKAISKVLKETDDLIISLESLINKKKKIKQGTMQELLSGKRRLEGFEGEWEVKKIKDISIVQTGITPSTLDLLNYGEEYLFVSPVDIKDSKYVYNTIKKLSKKGFKKSKKVLKGSILFTCIGSTIGKCAIASVNLATNQQINSISTNKDCFNHYLYYKLIFMKNKIKGMASEQALPIINKKTFEEIEIKIPKSIKEQKAIAQILSDMDIEIESLEKKLKKYKKIKQGMMQELLTGRIRLL